MAAGLRLADGVLLCVDVAEGCMVSTDKAVKAALAEGLPIALLLTKVSYASTKAIAGCFEGLGRRVYNLEIHDTAAGAGGCAVAVSLHLCMVSMDKAVRPRWLRGCQKPFCSPDSAPRGQGCAFSGFRVWSLGAAHSPAAHQGQPGATRTQGSGFWVHSLEAVQQLEWCGWGAKLRLWRHVRLVTALLASMSSAVDVCLAETPTHQQRALQ